MGLINDRKEELVAKLRVMCNLSRRTCRTLSYLNSGQLLRLTKEVEAALDEAFHEGIERTLEELEKEELNDNQPNDHGD